MKYRHYIILLLACFQIATLSAASRSNTDTLQFTYREFMKQQGIRCVNGLRQSSDLTLNIYETDGKYYLEIPAKALGRDILVAAQTDRTYSGMLSPDNGVIRFEKGNDIHSLFMTRNRTIDVQADSTGVSMKEALRQSAMLPIDMAFNVVCMGPHDKSYIIDITNDVTTPNGLFNMTSNSSLNNPDPKRSGVTGMRGIDGGVVIEAMRSQTDMVNRTMTEKMEYTSTIGVQMVIQIIPSHAFRMKLNDPFYGFNTVSRQEYDTKTYVSRMRNYIQRWNITDKDPVTVYISPLIPSPFRKSILAAFDEWKSAFTAIGIKEPFRFSSDEKDAVLAYHHIYVGWNNVGDPHFTTVINSLTGEIVSARLDISDGSAEDVCRRYYVLCRHIDKSVFTDMLNIGMRQRLVQAMSANTIGGVLGLRPNASGNSAFTPSQLRSEAWLKKNGISASVTDELAFNYLAQDGDGVQTDGLLPKVSVYDREAIDYAYGKRTTAPSTAFFTYVDRMKDYMYPKRALSNDWIEAARLGTENIKKSYAAIHTDFAKMKGERATYDEEYHIILSALGEYQQLMENVAALVGKETDYPIMKGVNLRAHHFTPKATQAKALEYLRSEILTDAPAWANRSELKEVCSANVPDMMRAIAVAVYKRLLSKETAIGLVKDEQENGDRAFTTDELYRFIDHNLMCDYDATKPVPRYQRLLMANVLPDLANRMFSSDLSLGIDNEGVLALHAYFMHVAEKVAYLAEHHQDKETRENYKMIKMRLDRYYFDKDHK